MKKIIRGVLLGVLALVIIAGAAVAVFLFGGKKPDVSPQPYIVDSAGTSYLAVVDEDGVTYAAVTDAVGNIYAAEVDESGNIGETKGQINDQVDPAKLPTNYTGEHIDVTADINAFTGSAETVDEPATQGGDTQPTTVPSGADTPTTTAPGGGTDATKPSGNGGQATTTTQAQKQHYRIEKYQEMFKSGQYLMEFKSSDPELGDTPITLATKNGNIVIDSKIQNFNCKMLYLSNEDKTYILIDNMKKYSELPPEMMGDEGFDMSEMTKGFAKEMDGDYKVSTVKVNGKTLNCETRVNPDGSETRYLFDGDTLVRIDDVAADGTLSSTYISRLTSDVPDSTFEIPKNYSYLNLSWLANMAG